MKKKKLGRNASGIIKGFHDEVLATRFLAMGVRPGCEIEVVRRSFFGGAYYVRIDQKILGLRKSELKALIIESA